MLQPISQTNFSNRIYKQPTTKVNVVPMQDYILNKDVEVVNYLHETKKQNEIRNKLLLVGIGVMGVCMLLLAYVLAPGSKKSSVSSYGKGMANDFVSLAKDSNIPTLETCKSLNKKMKAFLQKQVNYANATSSDIAKTGMPNSDKKLLLYGPPGTGKSFFAKIFAKTLGAEYVEVKFADFNSTWSGEHIENLKSVFEEILSKATTNPKKKFVVTLNEIDAVLQPADKLMHAGSGHSMFKLEERSTILNYIDEITQKAPNVTIIGTTNISPKNNGLDGAAMSRFKNLMEVNYPDKECLFEALKAHLEKIENGEKFVSKNKSKLENFAKSLEERQSSFRDLDSIVDSSKGYYLDDYMKDKGAKFKFEYLENAKNNIDLTDGEISGTIGARGL